MELDALAWISVAAVGLGAFVTYTVGKCISAPLADMAAKHGRFAGLGETKAQRPASGLGQGHSGREVMHVARIAH
jgi:hypothetical protein